MLPSPRRGAAASVCEVALGLEGGPWFSSSVFLFSKGVSCIQKPTCFFPTPYGKTDKLRKPKTVGYSPS